MKKKILFGFSLLALITSLVACKTNNDSNISVNKFFKSSEIFTDRDLEQNVNTSNATTYTVVDNENITIDEEGIYVIKGNANNSTIIVNTDSDSKVQLVLDNLTITNENTPCLYVKNADKVFVTLTGTNYLTVTDSFTSDGDTNTDAVIFSKDDLVINGEGSLNIKSSENGITSKDDLKITGGNINVTSVKDAIEANDSISINDGNITITSKKDGLHSECDDDSTGYIYINGGTINIESTANAIHATTIVQIDNGNITLSGREGIEGTYIQINDGNIEITATDDGINAGSKSSKYDVTIEINGGTLSIDMGSGDTDAIDANGNLYINGGTINITAQSPFDYDNIGELNGGDVYVNGNKVTELTNQMMNGKVGKK